MGAASSQMGKGAPGNKAGRSSAENLASSRNKHINVVTFFFQHFLRSNECDQLEQLHASKTEKQWNNHNFTAHIAYKIEIKM